MRVRKKHPGSSSHGHEWTKAGEVLDIPVEDATDCMRVAPDEFEVLADEPEPDPAKEPVTEPDPEPEPEPEPEEHPVGDKKPATRGRRRVTED